MAAARVRGYLSTTFAARDLLLRRSLRLSWRRGMERGDCFLQGSVLPGARAVAQPVEAQCRDERRVDIDENERDASCVEVVQQCGQPEPSRIVHVRNGARVEDDPADGIRRTRDQRLDV